MSAEAQEHEPFPCHTLQDPDFHPRQKDVKKLRRASGQRRWFLGLETESELVWEDWEPGGEFTKSLVLRNVRNKLHKLSIRPPESGFFQTFVPHTVLLSPGISYSIPVTFRPLQRCEYEDCIEFLSAEGRFPVNLRAVTPSHSLKAPDSVLLPLCGVQHSSQAQFLLKNLSKLQTFFLWDCAPPFHIRPARGLLKPEQTCSITVVFEPQEAKVFQQEAHCRFGEEEAWTDSCSVLLQGGAKYPHLQFRGFTSSGENEHRDPVLQFGSVAVGHSSCRHFEIFNPSLVEVSFSLSRLPGVEPVFGSEFSCDVTAGVLVAGGSLRASVTYSPAEVDAVSVEYLSLTYRGALSKANIKLTGRCTGPEVSLSSSLLDFGSVEEKQSAAQTLEMINSSSIEAFYQWEINNSNSIFSIHPAGGAVPPQNRIKVTAVYRPRSVMEHSSRVACLILHREPMFLDLVGTCRSELQKPAGRKPRDVRKIHGENPADIHHKHDDKHHPNTQEGHAPTMEEPNQTNAAVVRSNTPMEELYRVYMGSTDLSSASPSPHVSLTPHELLFHHKLASSSSTDDSSSQYVSIKNHSSSTLSLVWTLVKDSPFTLSPSSCDLAPLKSTSFLVTYAPKDLNTLHGGRLECFAFYKVSPGVGQPGPPWCGTVRVIGHSFQSGREHFRPNCSLMPSHVSFPPLAVVSYRTVLLQNHGDLPLTFCLDRRPESVEVLPSCGLIQPRRHQILTLRAVPTEDSPKQGFTVSLRLNAADFTQELSVLSVLEKPRVSLDCGAILYFHPTAVGSETQRRHHIRNLSRLPLRFHWSVPESHQNLFSVGPDAGVLHPNESSVQVWSFRPVSEKTHQIKPTLSFWPVQSDGSEKSQLTLEVVGTGSCGSIKAENPVLDVGEVLVGTDRLIEVPLVNDSPCPVSFRLTVQQKLTGNSDSERRALQLHSEGGSIHSRCKAALRSTLRADRRAQYLWTISYQVLDANGFALHSPQTLCEVRAEGVIPVLQVVDACSSGAAAVISKRHMWELFSLDGFNEHVRSAGLCFQTTTKRRSNHTKVLLDFNFSSAPLNSDPSGFMLMFQNPGSVPVDWAFLLPDDHQVELDRWTDGAEFSSKELNEEKSGEHLFSISPCSGTLPSGQQRAVCLSYRHDLSGSHWLPVVFRLSHGREMWLNFRGLTADLDKPCLHFASGHHVFSSVALGDCSPPLQMYEIHNSGAVSVHYEVDSSVLLQLQEDNFNHAVLRCLNPRGEVLPGRTAVLEWIFSPLEAKVYHMEVPVHIQNSSSALLRFEGRGLQALKLNSSDSDCEVAVRSVRRRPFPGQLLFLSEDSVSLGDIPVLSPSSRIFFLTNVSNTDSVVYSWQLPLESGLQIRPERGRVGPGGCDLCVLTFTPSDYPAVYQLDLVCQVTPEAALTRYLKALDLWEQEKQRQLDGFTVSDPNVSERRILLIEKEPTRLPRRLRKCKTLPPLHPTESFKRAETSCTKQGRAERKVQIWRRPEPPQPALLHLSVTAQSHTPEVYRTHLPERFRRHCRYLQLMDPRRTVSTSPPAGQPASLHRPGRDVTVNILNSLLRDILADSVFLQSLRSLASKAPFYRPAETSCCSPTPPTPPPAFGGATAGPTRTSSSERVPVHMAEAVLMNTFQNLMMAAVKGELGLTAPPRGVSVPSPSVRNRLSSRDRRQTDE
ncbi:cilia- and flagella-associated protein 65 isoform X3 [Oryzias melastigma]|uniref:cilia- and flagella-associated protein 65 isoform X3 n=1 Tax=Oryzias melastigma TaxID=30732 RepID=UPI000CF7CF22|nr:cilia- and flagella-associated protein 65 isoform X3 [Oryzias melastigma]